MDTQTQIDRLIELAIIQRSELKQLVEQLPQLREHLNAEVEKVFDETEPQLRAELEEWTTKQTADKTAALGVALEAKIADLAKSLEVSTQARYNAIIAERAENARLAAQAEAKIAEHAASLPGAVKEIVTAELARFPRAGEIDQLRKEFAEPRGLNPRGKWQAGETYNKLDLVTINGDSYTSNTDGNRTRPSRSSADWTLVAARGTGGGGGPTSLTDLTTVPSDGDLLIGSGTSWVTSNLTAGAGISITVGPGAITISATDGDITLDDGTAASPSLHFTNDPDTGIYRPAENTLGISVSGTQVAYFDENGLTVPSAGVVAGGSIHAGNGNANNPSLSFDGDQDTGFFRHQPNEIGIALGGTQYATLTSTTFSITPVVTMASSLRVNGTTDSSSKDTGAIVTEGGLGVEKSATIGGNLTVSGTGGVSISAASSGTFLGAITQNTSVNGFGGFRATNDAGGTTRSTDFAVGGTTAGGNFSNYGYISAGSALSGFRIFSGGTTLAATFDSSGNTTLAGNLTVSGGTVDITSASSAKISGSTAGSSGTLSLISNTAGNYRSLQFGYGATPTYLWKIGYQGATSNDQLNFESGTGTVAQLTQSGALTLSSNLTVSGTGTSSVAGNLFVGTTTAAASGARLQAQLTGTDGTVSTLLSLRKNTNAAGTGVAIDFTPDSTDNPLAKLSAVRTSLVSGYTDFRFSTWNGSALTEQLRLVGQTGNLLIGTTTDSGNGKLQLATHTTSAGGIGFGTALSMYRSSDNSAWVDAASGNVQLVLARAGTANLAVLSDGSNVYASAVPAGMGLIFRTNGSTNVLTLDSSQNATFAGRVTSNGTGFGVGADSTSSTPFYALSSVNGTFGTLVKNTNAGSGAFAGVFIEADSGQASVRQHSTLHSVWPGKTLISAPSGGTGLVLLTNGAGDAIDFWTNATQALSIDASQNIVPGTAALATTATNGFIYLQTCAGAPTGIPTTYTGRVASIYDTTNNKLYIYNGGWKSVALA